jgi:hypothetical protein
MNTQTTTQLQPTKKLVLKKQKICILSVSQQWAIPGGPTANCTSPC